jgi:hypothetical protein
MDYMVGVVGQSNGSWQACTWWSSCSCMSIRGTHLAQTLWYSNVASIVSDTLNLTFSSVQRYLVIICRFAQMSWSSHSSFREVAAMQDHPEHGLSHITVATAEMHHPLPHFAPIHCLVSVNVQQASMNVKGCSFFLHREIQWHLCFVHTFMSHANLLDCYSAVCSTATELTNYWREDSASTAISPAFPSNIVCQHNKIGDITFRVHLMCIVKQETTVTALCLLGVAFHHGEYASAMRSSDLPDNFNIATDDTSHWGSFYSRDTGIRPSILIISSFPGQRVMRSSMIYYLFVSVDGLLCLPPPLMFYAVVGMLVTLQSSV